MLVDGLVIPERLVALINLGSWPRTEEEELRQNLESLVGEARIKLVAPEQNKIYFVRPPFNTVARLRSIGHEEFWLKFGVPEEIEAKFAVFLGDFGLGSDAPILLDYRENRLNPTVIRLKWNYGVGA